MGQKLRLTIKLMGIDRNILAPITSMKWLMTYYAILGFTTFIVWIVGSVLLKLGVFCVTTAPELYAYTLFLVAAYWMGFIWVILYLIKLNYGSNIVGMLKEQMKAPSMNELEDRIFRKQFNEFDKEKEGKVATSDLPALLQSLGVYVPDAEIPALQKTLDPSGSGSITFDEMNVWFKRVNGAAEDALGEGDEPPP